MKKFKISISMMIILVLLICLGGLSSLIYAKTRSMITSNLKQHTAELTSSYAADVGLWLKERKDDMELIANLPILQSGDKNAIMSFLDNEARINNIYEQFFIADTQGNYNLNTGQTGSIADRQYFQDVMATGETEISEPLISRGSGNQIVVVAAPIMHDNKIIGLVGGNVRLTEITQQLANIKIGTTCYAIMVQSDGRFIAHPDRNMMMKFNPLKDPEAPAGLKAAVSQMVKARTGFARYLFLGQDKYIAYAPVPGMSWSMGITLPVEYINDQLKYLPLYFLVLTVIFGIVLIVVLNRWMAAPLKRLAKVTNQISTNLNEPFEIEYLKSPVAEVNILSQNFKMMVNELRENFRELRYINQHDPLTGLFNRRHFEEKLNKLRDDTFCPIGIAIFDVDGLKLVNDTLGHKVGDKLLEISARLIQECFPKEEISRIGGDEFAVIIENCDSSYMHEAYYKLDKFVLKFNEENPEFLISLSIGTALGDKDKNIEEIFKEADNSMYREKLHRSKSTRSAIVHTLAKALEARDFITEGHAERLQELVGIIGGAAGMSERVLTDLRLLAQFHDIGKVGIPDRILFKPGPLSQEERIEMQRHSEIGYRIAQSAPDLVPIADWILKHHEQWNGTGYPLGLKGREIPLECRILAIVDAYDAMTNDRPYRLAMSHEEAVEELIRKAEIQFDPELVLIFLDSFNNQQLLQGKNRHDSMNESVV